MRTAPEIIFFSIAEVRLRGGGWWEWPVGPVRRGRATILDPDPLTRPRWRRPQEAGNPLAELGGARRLVLSGNSARLLEEVAHPHERRQGGAGARTTSASSSLGDRGATASWWPRFCSRPIRTPTRASSPKALLGGSCARRPAPKVAQGWDVAPHIVFGHGNRPHRGAGEPLRIRGRRLARRFLGRGLRRRRATRRRGGVNRRPASARWCAPTRAVPRGTTKGTGCSRSTQWGKRAARATPLYVLNRCARWGLGGTRPAGSRGRPSDDRRQWRDDCRRGPEGAHTRRRRPKQDGARAVSRPDGLVEGRRCRIMRTTSRRPERPEGRGRAADEAREAGPTTAGFVALIGAPNAGKVDAAQPARGLEGLDRLAQGADDARAGARHRHPRPRADRVRRHAGHLQAQAPARPGDGRLRLGRRRRRRRGVPAWSTRARGSTRRSRASSTKLGEVRQPKILVLKQGRRDRALEAAGARRRAHTRRRISRTPS